MQRITTVVLLCALAVMTLSITTLSCTGKVLGGPNIPREEGSYIDAGFGWKSEKEAPWRDICNMFVDPSITGTALIATGKDFEEGIVSASTISLQGSRIRLASRLTPSEKQMSSMIALMVCDFQLYPLSRVDSSLYQTCEGGCWGCKQADMFTAVSADRSDYEAGYTYIEIDNIPSSPTGWYSLHYAGKMIFLRREGSSIPAATTQEVSPPAPVGELICNVFYMNVKNVTLSETRWTHYIDAAIGDRVSFLIYTELTNTSTDQTLAAQLTGHLGNNLQYIHQSAYFRKNNSDQKPMPDNWVTGEHNLAIGLQTDPQQTVPIEITFDARVGSDLSNQLRVVGASAALEVTNNTETDDVNIGFR